MVVFPGVHAMCYAPQRGETEAASTKKHVCGTSPILSSWSHDLAES
jgi:hypothetical protein